MVKGGHARPLFVNVLRHGKKLQMQGALWLPSEA
jgi:hypothetical protein